MKLFGEYLVEKQLISKDVLARALIDQMKVLPSAAEVAFENKLLSTDQLLAVFRHQIENKSSFVESAEMLSAWSPEVAAKVEEHVASIRTPLGQVLVKMGSLTLEQIVHALDDFFSEVEPKKADPATPVVSGGMYEAFCDLFTPTLRDKLGTLFAGEPEPLRDGKEIKDVKDEIHRLKGAARLVDAAQCAHLLGTYEDTLGVLLALDLSALKPELISKLKTTHQKTIDLLWTARQAHASGKYDKSTLEALFEEVDAQIQFLNFDLGFLEKKKVETHGAE